ncbi:GGDEF domain-containing protein [Paramagnetospirillum kuznetsovii]|uniref:GGDEF domain-containing protein n=1 Tax=Paramagnetospirillum kuznetsovii TaxID=2053833 RepID=A0A364P1P8_9PROT|nr:GGDEF domain-containing protein [Paramagnetospirillum kuznetsovii]RAU23269.1 GGDEF domain-containing protein [Paramagnetospirillum kuznetsovii]
MSPETGLDKLGVAAAGARRGDRWGQRDIRRPFSVPGRLPPLPSEDHWNDIVGILDIAFQPIVNIHSGACYGYEALLRNTEQAGFATIGEVFDACHALGILADMEVALCEKAMAKFATLPNAHDTKLFLNVDNRALDAEGDLPRRMRAIMDRHDLAGSSVAFEISERHPLGPPDDVTAIFRHYKRNGFRLAIDDFGTGFSGLQLLYFSEPDLLKIDRFFISDIAGDAKKKVFLAHIVNIAHLLGVVVVAEGVETEREFFTCKEIGCDLIQGWLAQHPTTHMAELAAHYDVIEELARRERRATTSDQKIIADQIIRTAPILTSAPMEHVFARFRADKSATFFPVVDNGGQPVGIVREKELKDYTYSPYGKELIANKSFGRTLRDFVVRCPMADINNRAEQILEAYSAVERSEGIMIVDGMSYVGFLSAHSLLRVINEKNLAAARDQNPLSRLPGNTVIVDWVSDALDRLDCDFSLVYFDFDNFKPFNDKYGFRLGDRAILLFADLLSKTMNRDGGFAGHIGGDDFFAGFRAVDFAVVMEDCRALLEAFRLDVESFYDDETRKLGYIHGHDRLGNPTSFPLMTVSAVAVNLPAGRCRHSIDDVSRLIASLKKGAKSSPDHLSAATLVDPGCC